MSFKKTVTVREPLFQFEEEDSSGGTWTRKKSCCGGEKVKVSDGIRVEKDCIGGRGRDTIESVWKGKCGETKVAGSQ